MDPDPTGPADRDTPGSEPGVLPAHLVRTLTRGGGVAIRTIIGSNLIAEAMARRDMAPTAANALGRALMGTVLIAVGPAGEDGDEGESVQLQLRGDGPIGNVLVISDALGRVRGTVERPEANNALADGSPDVARAVGMGTLTVVRHRRKWREPYTGAVPLVSGEIAQDLTLYLTESEQTPSAMGLGVAMADDESAVVAAGFLVQILPDATPAEINQVEENVRSLPPLSQLALCDTDCDELIDLLSSGLGTRARTSASPVFWCPCTRERALRTLSLLERDELQEIIDENLSQEVCCHFCSRAYQISPDEVRSLGLHS
jgi:molecular chaperone Hsp33